MCADDQVTKVSRVDPEAVGRYSLSGRKSKRRLQSTVSAAGNAHGVSRDDHHTANVPTPSRIGFFLPATKPEPSTFRLLGACLRKFEIL